MSEFVTWETCPSCGGRLAVGWIGDPAGRRDGGTVVECDCPRGCLLTPADLAAVRSDQLAR